MNLENTKAIKQTAKNIYGMGQFSSVAQSCPTLWDPTDFSTPGLPVHHQLPESTQTNVHCITNVIQPSIRYLDSNVSKGVGKGQL